MTDPAYVPGTPEWIARREADRIAAEEAAAGEGGGPETDPVAVPAISTHNASGAAHADIRSEVTALSEAVESGRAIADAPDLDAATALVGGNVLYYDEASEEFKGIPPLLSVLTDAGDTIGFDGADAVRVPIGANGDVPTADDSEDAGWAWAAPSGGAPVRDDHTLADADFLPGTGWTVVGSASGNVVRREGDILTFYGTLRHDAVGVTDMEILRLPDAWCATPAPPPRIFGSGYVDISLRSSGGTYKDATRMAVYTYDASGDGAVAYHSGLWASGLTPRDGVSAAFAAAITGGDVVEVNLYGLVMQIIDPDA